MRSMTCEDEILPVRRRKMINQISSTHDQQCLHSKHVKEQCSSQRVLGESGAKKAVWITETDSLTAWLRSTEERSVSDRSFSVAQDTLTFARGMKFFHLFANFILTTLLLPFHKKRLVCTQVPFAFFVADESGLTENTLVRVHVGVETQLCCSSVSKLLQH